jgi:hypothetical protein
MAGRPYFFFAPECSSGLTPFILAFGSSKPAVFDIFRLRTAVHCAGARLDKTSHRALTTRTYPRQLGSASRMHLTGVSLVSHRQPRDASPRRTQRRCHSPPRMHG